MNNYIIIENFNNIGNIIKKTISKIIITEDGIQGKTFTDHYNILLNNNELASDVWFDKYKIDEAGNCKFAVKRGYEDFKRLQNFKIYNDDNNHLLEKYTYAYGVINKMGILVIDPLYERVKYANENAYIVSYNTKYGYFSSIKKEQITPIIFENAKKFYEGYASVTYNNKSGYISRNHIITNPDEDRQYAIALNYEYANDFIDGIAEVGYYSKKVYIDKKNRQVKVRKRII